MVTIFRNIFDKQPHYIEVDKAFERIKTGRSKEKVEEIRNNIDKERRNNLKVNLPTVLFAGEFNTAKDSEIIKYENLIILDFDNITEHPDITTCELAKEKLIKNKYIYACWISPSGNGLKAVVKIVDGRKHKEHFQALQEQIGGIDKSGVNIARHCFESYDPNIYVNENSDVFKKIKTIEKIVENKSVENKSDVFTKILTWLTNKGDAFVKGERNYFIFKLASACCRFGIGENETILLIRIHIPSDSSFSMRELERTVKSAYKSSAGSYNTAEFTNERLIDKISRKEIETKEIDADIYNLDVKPKDVIFGEDVKKQALEIFEKGYEKVNGVGVPALDDVFKLKLGEITLLTGIGNYGKSSFLKWFLVMRIILFKEKFALFTPEDNPAEEFYHDMVEVYLGANCTVYSRDRPSKEVYTQVYEMIGKYLFYIYPKEIAPTPDYIKERFLELIIKEKINGCIIDPFNQLSNDYGQRTDKYLETFLSDCSRFAQVNNVYFLIVAHPRLMRKKEDGNYPCPDVYDIADGAMWNNKMDNIIVYHRPNHQTDPLSTICEFHSKKIRRQKTVGKKGFITFDLNRGKRRYLFDGVDPIARLLNEDEINYEQEEERNSGLPF